VLAHTLCADASGAGHRRAHVPTVLSSRVHHPAVVSRLSVAHCLLRAGRLLKIATIDALGAVRLWTPELPERILAVDAAQPAIGFSKPSALVSLFGSTDEQAVCAGSSTAHV
jgi:hypothetical protein